MLRVDPELLPMEARERYIEMLRRIPLGKRFELGVELNEMARAYLAKEIQAAYPGISDEDVRNEIIRLTIPEELRKKAYGW